MSLQIGESLLPIVFEKINRASVIIGIRLERVYFDRATEISKRAGNIARVLFFRAPVVVDVDVLRIELDGTRVIGDRACSVTISRFGSAALKQLFRLGAVSQLASRCRSNFLNRGFTFGVKG